MGLFLPSRPALVATRPGSLWALLRPRCQLTCAATCPLALLLEVLQARLRQGRPLQCPLMPLATFPPVTPRDPFPLSLLRLTRLPRAPLMVRVTLLTALRPTSRLPPRAHLRNSRRMRRVMFPMDTRRMCPLLVLPLSFPLIKLVRTQPARPRTFRPLRPAFLLRSLLMGLAMLRLLVRLGSP